MRLRVVRELVRSASAPGRIAACANRAEIQADPSPRGDTSTARSKSSVRDARDPRETTEACFGIDACFSSDMTFDSRSFVPLRAVPLAAILALVSSCAVRPDPEGPGLDDGGPSASSDDGGGAGFDIGGHPSGDDAAAFDIGHGGDVLPTDSSCAGATEKASPVPLDLFIMQDQSGSMKEATSTGVTKWEAVKSAFKAFMDDPSTAGIEVGLQYFGHAGLFSGGASSCDIADYSKPDVEIAPLPGVSSSIMNSLLIHFPYTDTPTAPALQGALDHAHTWQAAHPGHVVVVVLATDGMPTACTPTDIPSIAAFATTAAAAKPAIRTYVIGVLSDSDLSAGAEANLNQISKAGNGDDAFIIKTSSGDTSKSFLAALQKIRGTALSCEYLVPTGAGADYNKVNVVVTNGGTSTTIPYVGSAAKCDATTGGWYYDVAPGAGTPTKILTCGATCAALSLDAGGKVDIQVGCATVGPR